MSIGFGGAIHIHEKTKPQQELSQRTIDPGDIVEIVKSNLETYSAIIVTVRATYHPDARYGVLVAWLYSQDGQNFDSPEDAWEQGNYERLTFKKGQTRQRTILIPAFTPYVKIQIVNLDISYPVTVDVWTSLMRGVVVVMHTAGGSEVITIK